MITFKVDGFDGGPSRPMYAVFFDGTPVGRLFPGNNETGYCLTGAAEFLGGEEISAIGDFTMRANAVLSAVEHDDIQ